MPPDAPAPRLTPLGDAAFMVALPDAPGPATTARLAAAVAALRDAPGVIDAAAAFRTLTVHLDPLAADRAALEALALEAAQGPPAALEAAEWRVPVCFDPDCGPDQQEVAAECGLPVADIVDLMARAELTVLMVGFLPGFPFCGPAPAPLALPRKKTPRLRVPPGSVAVAMGFAGIYPWESPGGWRILGHCPLRLFDPAHARPALFAAGDRLRLEPVSRAEHDRAAAADPRSFRA